MRSSRPSPFPTKNKTSAPFVPQARNDRFAPIVPVVRLETSRAINDSQFTTRRGRHSAASMASLSSKLRALSAISSWATTGCRRERLAHGIALIVMPAPREREELRLEIRKPWRALGKKNQPKLELC